MPSPPNNRLIAGQVSDDVDLDSELAMLSDSYHGGYAHSAGHGSEADASATRRRSRLQSFAGDSVYVAFVTTAWLAINVLGALGCAVAFFIVISAGEWDAFFLQLDNLTSRYVAADIGRRGLFEHQIAQAFLLMFGTISLLRLPGFIRGVRGGLIQGRAR